MAFERGTLKLGNSVGSKAEMREPINDIYILLFTKFRYTFQTDYIH